MGAGGRSEAVADQEAGRGRVPSQARRRMARGERKIHRVGGTMDDQNVVAFTPQCTHLACAYHWEERRRTILSVRVTPRYFRSTARCSAAPRRGRWTVTSRKIDSGKVMIGSEIQKPLMKMLRASSIGSKSAPASRPPSSISSTKTFPLRRAGTRCWAAWRCSRF